MIHLPAWLQSVHHDGSDAFVSNPYPRLGDAVQIRLRAGVGAPIRRVFVRSAPDGEQAFVRMEPEDAAGPARWWQVELPVNQPLVHYRFALEAEDGVWWLNAAGPGHFDPLDAEDFKLLADYDPPAWLHSSVFYQIFPDRFANGDPDNDPQPHEYEYRGHGPQTFPWGTLPPDDYPFPLVFFGGDLHGITQHLDYVEQLGINALYLNPVFTAPSNHKYDVIDYEHVDPHFGGDEALAALRAALDQRNMRYLLDIVPNHCGYWHPWFTAARADASAPEAAFFTFTEHPEKYAAWLGVWTLPKLNYKSTELRRRIYEGEDAVFRRWLRSPFSADGWRVDVANMLARHGGDQLEAEVWAGIRQAVKDEKPQAYLLGENFFDASRQLQGDQLDATMNYAGFTNPLLYWLDHFQVSQHGEPRHVESNVPWPTEALAATWQASRASIPWTIARQQLNLLGSHDTARILHVVKGDAARNRIAVAFLLTYPGVPCIYYGDEIGMSGAGDPDNRRMMRWGADVTAAENSVREHF
ncbi:MAG TPA: alpha-amylase family glycosyl hydrolase, partial [Anaerolineae bacterium]|nr:alpha-amylase family glycosyl hydrolase [Anaerolineae bacterium]